MNLKPHTSTRQLADREARYVSTLRLLPADIQRAIDHFFAVRRHRLATSRNDTNLLLDDIDMQTVIAELFWRRFGGDQ